jgi:hypothetical protein
MLQLPDWYIVGCQNTVQKTFRYIPTGWVDPSGSTGLLMREASRAWEVCFYPSLPFTLSLSVHELTAMQYALGDFAVHQAAIMLDKSAADVGNCASHSMNFVNMWDLSVTSNGFSGFVQRRYPVCFILPPLCSNTTPAQNGTFAFSPLTTCSLVDPVGHSCARGTDNNVGFHRNVIIQVLYLHV